jgi:hypothetical protein
MTQGRPKAWSILYKRITKQQDWGRQPTLDDASLQRIIRTFTVKNERRSTTRYVADVTYTFSPEGVARVLQGGGIALTQGQAKRILLVPFSPNYSGGSMWTAAFSGMRYAGSSVPFALPSGAGRARRTHLRGCQLGRCRTRRGSHPCHRSGSRDGGAGIGPSHDHDQTPGRRAVTDQVEL